MVQAGALPFMAMGNMPEGIAREGLALAREKTQGNFGVGLIGLEVNRACYESHLEIMKQDPPAFRDPGGRERGSRSANRKHGYRLLFALPCSVVVI